jgi:hypothetical protein
VRTDGNVNISVTSFLAPTPSVTREFAIAEKKRPGENGQLLRFRRMLGSSVEKARASPPLYIFTRLGIVSFRCSQFLFSLLRGILGAGGLGTGGEVLQKVRAASLVGPSPDC